MYCRNSGFETGGLGERSPGRSQYIRPGPTGKGFKSLEADEGQAEPLPNLPFEYRLGKRYLYADADGQMLFTNNETNAPRVWGAGAQSRSPFVKDAFHRYVIDGEQCINPAEIGTKSCFHFAERNVPAGGSIVIKLRLSDKVLSRPLADVDEIIATRHAEADEFYNSIHPAKASEDERQVQRQAFAGMLWGKQIYFYDIDLWLTATTPTGPRPNRVAGVGTPDGRT